MKENFPMINSMEGEFIPFPTEKNMRDLSLKAINMATVPIHILMALIMKENGLMAGKRATVFFAVRETITKENGTSIKWDRANMSGKTGIATKDISSTMHAKEKELTDGHVANVYQGTGKTIS